MRDELRCIGFIAATAPSLFPCPVRSSLPAVYPSPIKVSSSSFSCVSPLQSSFALSPRSRPFGPSTTCLGFHASSRHHPHASTPARTPTSIATFRPQAFSASRRFSPRSGLRTYFIPQPRPGSSRSRGSLFAQPPFLIGKSLPPCRCFRARSPTEISCHAPRPSTSRLLSVRRYVPTV